ncbi:diacylglycerol kinase [Desulfolithobacter dissulfuricans]|uniref:Diacylglycerol kinase n=1 Tax=Desulfolithobacter dissulfuricans TaxID=2795293 RepID=A0A915UB35_9BACT|nr:diacylglycerol kinase [Desulfolithobacter dissulfuricans]BCO10581.1 diacylglycerol kinase [Desulfolithobacter dissulfuricans]
MEQKGKNRGVHLCNKPDYRGLRHVYQAMLHSFKGLAAAFRCEEAFRLELLVVAVMLPLGLWLGNSGVERSLLVGSLLLVLIVELINSAIEAVVDRISLEHHVLSGRAKDIGSGAVFMTLVNVAVIWGLLLYERLSCWLSTGASLSP